MDAGTIRLATRADAAMIATMSRDQIEQGLPWSWTEARVAGAIRNADTNVAVIGEHGALQGFGIMAYRDDVAHLLLFTVRPERRRLGMGSALLRWLEDVAITAAVQRVVVECRRDNAAARNFYAERGYHELAIAKGYYRGVEDAIRLEKWLHEPQEEK
ncbi:MAG TPA: GNAT family N-acetyltransferase [Steroidobacteraceae bacterium]|nr:GNAT family N-acetyltransferase [Steroidobacteraceae bacterium]